MGGTDLQLVFQAITMWRVGKGCFLGISFFFKGVMDGEEL
jgi:hypothetical protein